MKLCADILYWRLKEELTGVLFHGRKNSTLILNRPEFYLDRSQSFEENSVYVCSADHLPQTPELGENVCLVCLGEHWNLNAYYERCSVILIHGSQDIFRIFNLVQEVFNQYDTWEERLWFILRHGAALSQMLDASRGIFENPMLLIGSDFRYLGVTEEEYLKNNWDCNWTRNLSMLRKWQHFCLCMICPTMFANLCCWNYREGVLSL